jgi:UDPglucose 6-dehydrogenase
VGGYCLTKDSLFAQWSLKHFYGSELQLKTTLEALRVNYAMPLHAVDLARTLCGSSLTGRALTLCGLSYLPNVPDTRNAPMEVVYDRLTQEQARLRVHDPLVATWPERPRVAVLSDLVVALRETDVAILAVNHEAYVQLSAADWSSMLPARSSLVDAANVISDDVAAALHAGGHRLMGVGKGHWRKKGYHQHV